MRSHGSVANTTLTSSAHARTNASTQHTHTRIHRPNIPTVDIFFGVVSKCRDHALVHDEEFERAAALQHEDCALHCAAVLLCACDSVKRGAYSVKHGETASSTEVSRDGLAYSTLTHIDGVYLAIT